LNGFNFERDQIPFCEAETNPLDPLDPCPKKIGKRIIHCCIAAKDNQRRKIEHGSNGLNGFNFERDQIPFCEAETNPPNPLDPCLKKSGKESFIAALQQRIIKEEK
jgi:hypothetical protein